MDYIIMWVLHDFGNVGKYKGTQSNTFRGLQANSTHLQLYDTQGCQYGLEPRIFSTYITILNPSTLIDKDGIATNATFFFLATFSIFSDTSEITDSLGSWAWDSNLKNAGGRSVLSPLHPPCSSD